MITAILKGNLDVVKTITPYTAIDRVGANRRLHHDNEEIGMVVNDDVMESYCDFAAHRGDMEIFKHIYDLSARGRWPRKTKRISGFLKVPKNTKGRTPDYFAKGAFKQKIIAFMHQNQ